MQNSLSSLTGRLQARAEQERKDVENLIRQQFNALRESLGKSSKSALSTTESAILHQLAALEKDVTSRCQTLSWMFARKSLQALFLSFSIVTGAGLGGWGLMTLAGNKITTMSQEITSLKEQRQKLEETAANLNAQTWGLELREEQGGRFIIFPPDVNPKTGWSLGGRKAVKLEE